MDLRQDSGRAMDSSNIGWGGDRPISQCCDAEVQNESMWQLKSETAGASGGAREGRPRLRYERNRSSIYRSSASIPMRSWSMLSRWRTVT